MELALGITLKIYTSVAKELKVKVKKFFGLFPTFVEVIGEKVVGDLFACTILNRVKIATSHLVDLPFNNFSPPPLYKRGERGRREGGERETMTGSKNFDTWFYILIDHYYKGFISKKETLSLPNFGIFLIFSKFLRF